MIKIIFHPDAEKELWQEVDYYEFKKTGLGLDFEKEVRYAIKKIRSNPKRWPIYKFETRKILLKRFPHILYYTEYKDYIWIIAVAHTSKKPFYWKDRI